MPTVRNTGNQDIDEKLRPGTQPGFFSPAKVL
jgi:hypothetical protein